MDGRSEARRRALSIRFAALRAARRALRRFGLDLVRSDDEDLFHVRRARLLHERAIGVVLDVGANTGQYGRTLRADGYSGTIVSFEPLSEAFAELSRRAASDGAWECRRVALGDVDGERELHVARNSRSSSLLPISQRHIETAPESSFVASERVAVARLDSLRADLLGSHARAFVKLDVQGFERQVLDGATEALRQVEAIECELSLVPLYEGQALFSEVVERLDREAFDLVALERTFSDPRTGKLLQLDGLFVRRPR